MDTEDMQDDGAGSTRLRALFYTVAAVLAAGVATALVLAGLGVGSPGIIELPTAFTALGVTVGAVLVSLVITYAFLPAILAEERTHAERKAEAAKQSAWSQARGAVDEARANMQESVEYTAEAIRDEIRANESIMRMQTDANDLRVDQRFRALADDIAQQAAALESAANEREALAKDIDAGRVDIERVGRRIDGLRRSLREATQKLTKASDSLARSQKNLAKSIGERMDAFESYVDRHESRHSVLEAAIAFDTEELATLEARLEKSIVPGEPLEGVPGIEARYVKALADLGIEDTEQLRTANAHDLARKLRAFPGQIHAWQAMAELMRVSGIGPQYAELLENAGIHSMQDLARADPAELERRLESVQSAAGEAPPGGRRVAHWVKEARSLVG